MAGMTPKPPSRRQIELATAYKAGSEGDRKTFTRALIERRAASYAAMLAAYRRGQARKEPPCPD